MQNLTEAVYIYFKDERSRFLPHQHGAGAEAAFKNRRGNRKTDFDFFPKNTPASVPRGVGILPPAGRAQH